MHINAVCGIKRYASATYMRPNDIHMRERFILMENKGQCAGTVNEVARGAWSGGRRGASICSSRETLCLSLYGVYPCIDSLCSAQGRPLACSTRLLSTTFCVDFH